MKDVVLNDTPKSWNRLSKMLFENHIKTGKREKREKREKWKTGKCYAQRYSKVSELESPRMREGHGVVRASLVDASIRAMREGHGVVHPWWMPPYGLCGKGMAL
ncbi:MAG: hypothetical protein WCV67_17915 [Victivallaceae bacterium]